MKKKAPEKRLHPRAAVKLPVLYRLVGETTEGRKILNVNSVDREVKTRDASQGGLSIPQDGRLAVGKILNVQVLIPDRVDPLSAFVDVIWATGSAAGLKFLAMKERDSKALALFLKHNS